MLGYALTQGVTNLFLLVLPIVVISTLTSLVYIIYYIFEYSKSLTRYPMVCSLKAKDLAILAFVYGFGYFAPTIHVLQTRGTEATFLTQLVISNLAYDLIFTVLLSSLMLGRTSLQSMSTRLLLPVILCVVSICISDNLDTYRTGDVPYTTVKMQEDRNGFEFFSRKERYMHIMSRLCFCFVNVASKMFLLKGAAFQKAWSRLSENHNEDKFDEIMEKFSVKNNLKIDK